MREAGHDWFTDARANLLAHVSPSGTPQSVLISRMGISKQAVQQLVDGLVAEGVLERLPDPKDSRSRIVRYTDGGADAIRTADRIKQKIENEYRARLGGQRFETLMDLLREATEKLVAEEGD